MSAASILETMTLAVCVGIAVACVLVLLFIVTGVGLDDNPPEWKKGPKP